MDNMHASGRILKAAWIVIALMLFISISDDLRSFGRGLGAGLYDGISGKEKQN